MTTRTIFFTSLMWAVNNAALFADTIVLPQLVSLQLYGAYDEDHKLLDHQVRYTRRDRVGAVVTDVMLVRAQASPH